MVLAQLGINLALTVLYSALTSVQFWRNIKGYWICHNSLSKPLCSQFSLLPVLCSAHTILIFPTKLQNVTVDRNWKKSATSSMVLLNWTSLYIWFAQLQKADCSPPNLLHCLSRLHITCINRLWHLCDWQSLLPWSISPTNERTWSAEVECSPNPSSAAPACAGWERLPPPIKSNCMQRLWITCGALIPCHAQLSNWQAGHRFLASVGVLLWPVFLLSPLPQI